MVQVNSYLIWDESHKACIIDPGFLTKEEQDQFSTFLEDNDLHLERSIATHMHFDHLLGAHFIESLYGLSTEVPQEEMIALPSIDIQLKAFGINAPSGQFDYTATPLPDKVTFGNIELKVLKTPGHSPGHVTFYDEIDKILFCGDVLFRGGYGRYDLWGGDYNTLMGSIAQLLKLPNEVKVLSGHGPESTIGEERVNF